MLFQDMKLNDGLLKALIEMNIEQPTDIQEEAIPKILDSKGHILAQAKTGTGKTLAFSIPIAEKIDSTLHEVQAIIIVPTRELCKQVAEVFADLSKFRHLKVAQVYGGVSIDRQIQKIQSGAQIIVATPGRLIDLYNRGRVEFKNVNYVVLDEADRCLDMGFMPDIEFLLLDAMKSIKPRLFLFSATLLEQINKLAEKFTQGTKIININVSKDEMTVDNCDQIYYMIEDHRDKYYHFVRILRKEKPSHTIIFVNTKKTADWLNNRLLDEQGLELRIDQLSGDMTQKRREIVLDNFRNQKLNCIIATDVAARGLDIPEVSHVFNYDLPDFEENYVHRIGRTSRMDRKGKAISLVMKDQYNVLCRIEGFMNKEIRKMPLPARNQKGSSRPRRSNQNPQYRNNRNNSQSNSRSGGNSYSSNQNRSQSNSRRSRDGDKDDSYKPDRSQFLY